jgi:hypothetical protein
MKSMRGPRMRQRQAGIDPQFQLRIAACLTSVWYKTNEWCDRL